MERQLPERLWARADHVLESIELGLLVLAGSGEIVSINATATRLLGWTAGQLAGTDVHDTIHGRSHSFGAAQDNCPWKLVAAGGEPIRNDGDLFLRSDGSLVPVSWMASPLPAVAVDGGSNPPTGESAAGVVVVFSDATAAQIREVSEAASREQDRVALWDAQQSVSDLGWIAELTRVMSSTLDERESLGRLARLLTPRLADVCVVDIVDERGDLHRLGGSVGPGVELPVDFDELISDPAVQHQRDNAATRATVATTDVIRMDAATMTDPAILSEPSRLLLDRLGARSLLVVPLAARNRTVGIAGLIRLTDGAYSDGDMLLAADIGRRAGLVLDNARLFQVEQRMAERLQLALLPTVHNLGHLDVAARYLPASGRNLVGGDWYDVFTCPATDADTHILVVGDVAGHDLRAATTMAAMRNLLRGVAVTGTGGPASVLDTVDGALPTLDIQGTATVILVRAARAADGWNLTWSSAGHLPALLLDPTGRNADLLDGDTDRLLGTRSPAHRSDRDLHVPFGSTLVLYTDGLIERRGEDLDRGLLRLRQAGLGEPTDAATTLDRIVTATSSSPDDDTALLVARFL